MISATLNSLLDELEKIGERLTEKEKRERAIKFTALGTASGPVIAGTTGLIRGGYEGPKQNITQGTKMKRWLPATLATGAMVSGAVPALRHAIERDILEGAKERRALARKVEEARNAGKR